MNLLGVLYASTGQPTSDYSTALFWFQRAIDAGCDLWSGLHTFLADDQMLAERARAKGVVRSPGRVAGAGAASEMAALAIAAATISAGPAVPRFTITTSGSSTAIVF